MVLHYLLLLTSHTTFISVINIYMCAHCKSFHRILNFSLIQLSSCFQLGHKTKICIEPLPQLLGGRYIINDFFFFDMKIFLVLTFSAKVMKLVVLHL